LDFDIVVLSFLFDKHCLIMEYPDLKESSRDLQANCAICYLLSAFKLMYRKIRYDEESYKVLDFWVHLNTA